MTDNYSLLAPGPVNLHPKVRAILAEPMLHHRTPAFDAIFKKVKEDLKIAFQTQQNVMAISCTGSGGMEALMVNCLSRNDKILVVVSGKFGERWAEMGSAFGLNVLQYKVPWGESLDLEIIKKLIKENSDLKAIFTQACETSTAVAHDIQSLAGLTRQTDILLFVDGITALGAYPLPMDDWGIDGIVAGSQKAFMLPTGMAFIALSERAWEKTKTSNLPKFYFNLREEKKANEKGETWFSSNVAILRGLDIVLSLIKEKGLDAHFQEIKKRADFTRYFGQKMGLQLYAKSPADSVTALHMPPHIDGQKIRSDLETQFNITIMGGQDQLKGKIIRIGHMGYIQENEMYRLFEALQTLLKNSGYQPEHEISRAEMQSWWASK